MPRLVLNDEFWSELNKFLFQEAIYYKKHNLRMTVESMMYRMQVGCPRRDLPKALATDPDWEWDLLMATMLKRIIIALEQQVKKRSRPLVKAVQEYYKNPFGGRWLCLAS